MRDAQPKAARGTEKGQRAHLKLSESDCKDRGKSVVIYPGVWSRYYVAPLVSLSPIVLLPLTRRHNQKNCVSIRGTPLGTKVMCRVVC